MTTRQEVAVNRRKLAHVNELMIDLMRLHDEALRSWIVHGVTKNMVQEDIDGLIEDYKSLKIELESEWSTLL